MEGGHGTAGRKMPGRSVIAMFRCEARPDQNSRLVIVICKIVLMAMYGPQEIEVQAMGMTVFLDHLKMVLNSLDPLWFMRKSRGQRPGKQAEAQDRG